MPSHTSAQGAALYTPFFPYIYDWYVLGFVNSFVWRCSTTRILLPLFKENLSLIGFEQNCLGDCKCTNRQCSNDGSR
jgi:hypothetical protein